jgi:hypothetical protein
MEFILENYSHEYNTIEKAIKVLSHLYFENLIVLPVLIIET